jgi:hypothetical protein
VKQCQLDPRAINQFIPNTCMAIQRANVARTFHIDGMHMQMKLIKLDFQLVCLTSANSPKYQIASSPHLRCNKLHIDGTHMHAVDKN